MLRGPCTLVAVAFAIGCGGREPYHCTSSEQCVGNGASGVCEPSGFCSFVDASCPGGRKYEERAGGGLGGTCVVFDAGIDTPIVQSCIDEVTFGRHFGCVLRNDSTVWCAGENLEGQIGFGLAGATDVTEWMQVRDATTGMAITDATAIAAGQEHACMIRQGGALWCWGRGTFGAIGHGTTNQAPAAAAVRKDADNMPLTGIVEVVAGYDHTCARDGSGGIWCTGRNASGELGDGTTTQRNRAVPVLTAPAAMGGVPLTGAVSLTSAARHSCIRKANDETWCWGNNGNGALGDNTLANRPNPVASGMSKQIDAGECCAICRVNSDATVSCAGSTWRQRMGNGGNNVAGRVMTPTQVLSGRDQPPLGDVVEVAVGGVPCVRLADGTVKCWGDNQHGQVGANVASPWPIGVLREDGTRLGDVDKLWAHHSRHCARSNGEILCWGRGLNGEFGDGKREDRGRAAPLGFPCP